MIRSLTRLFALAVLLPALAAATARATTILHVNASASAAGADGNSWATAYPKLSDAITRANGLGRSADNPVQIWVASGTYYPVSTTADPRDAAFAPGSWISIIGGFSATNPESSVAAQSAATPLPVLSGDITYAGSQPQAFAAPTSAEAAALFARPDVSDPGFADNARNVVRIANATGVVFLRVVITGGYASSSAISSQKLQAMSLPTNGNDAANAGTLAAVRPEVAGGGIFVTETAAGEDTYDVVLNECLVVGNYAQGYGGGISVLRGAVSATHSCFAGNAAGVDGGAFRTRAAGTLTFQSSDFLRNTAGQGGGAADFESAAALPADWGAWLISTWVVSPSADTNGSRLRGEGIVNAGLMGYKMSQVIRSGANTGVSADLKQLADATGPATGPGAGYAKAWQLAGASDFATALTQHFGAGVFTDYWKTVFAPVFNRYGAPGGRASALFDGFDDAGTDVLTGISTAFAQAPTIGPFIPLDTPPQRPTDEEIRFGYTLLANPAVPALFRQCHFADNTAGADGGAILAARDNVRFESCIFERNTSEGDGGALATAGFNTCMAFNTVFSANAAAGDAAVASLVDANTRLINCTIVDNQAGSAQACALGCELGAQLRVYNSVLWGNRNTADATLAGGADVYTARAATLSGAELSLYHQNSHLAFTMTGITEIANSDVQGLGALTNDWNGLADTHLIFGPTTGTAQEIKAIVAETHAMDQEGTQEYHGQQWVGEGNHVRESFSQDPLLFNGWIPNIGSPLIEQGSNVRLSNSAYSPGDTTDVLNLPRGGFNVLYPTAADALAANVTVGAVQSVQTPTSVSGATPGRIFVKAVASGNHSGSDWANATNDLKTALATDHAEVWVAAGTYYPSATGDATASFVLGDGTVAYGGFAGGETMLSARNIVANPTILSGRLADVSPGATASYHVVRGANRTVAVTLDGFTITGGAATGSAADQRSGGGLRFDGAPVRLRNTTITGNTAVENGGGLYATSSTYSSVVDCAFDHNAAVRGGAVHVTGNLTIDRTRFTANTAQADGAAIVTSPLTSADAAQVFNSLLTANTSAGSALSLDSTHALVQNCTLVHNAVFTGVAFNYGDADAGTPADATLRNSIVYANGVGWTGGTYLPESASVTHVSPEAASGITATFTVANCAIQYLLNFATNGNLDPGDPGFVDAAGGDFHLTAASPLVNAGAGAVVPAYALDVDGLPRQFGSAVDVGACEYQGAATTIAGSLQVVRSFAGTLPTYTLSFNPVAPLGGAITYTWTVNKGDGTGYVALPADAAGASISGAGTATLRLTAPPPAWNGWVFRVQAQGDAAAQAAAALSGLSRTRLYVNAAATGANNGSSWTDAYQHLEDALDSAGDYAEVWVARGTYQPSAGHDPTKSFVLRPGLVVLGGFAGTETTRAQRDVAANPTILSGAYETPAAAATTANYVVSYVVSPPQDATLPSLLDGFTVRNGRYAAITASTGGGFTINQCVISSAFNAGLVVLNAATVTLTDSTITGCPQGGLAVSNASAVLQRCVIVQNASSLNGAGILAQDSAVSLDQCTIADNVAAYAGGGLYAEGASAVTVSRSILWHNLDASAGTDPALFPTAQLATGSSATTASVLNSIWQGVATGTTNQSVDPLFTAAYSGDYSLSAPSPAIALGAGAIPFSGSPATALSFASLPPSTTQYLNVTSQPFTATWDPANGYALTWEVNLGNGWVSAASSGLTSSVSSSPGSSTLTLSTGSTTLPNLLVRARMAGGVYLPAAQFTVVPPKVVRVDARSTTLTPDGSTWASAYPSINSALAWATPGTEVWVAKGTYTEGNLAMQPRMVLVGGFAGTETTRAQRVLSADTTTTIRGTLVPPANGATLGSQVVADGFTVSTASLTGGIVVDQSGGAIVNCTVSNTQGPAVLASQSRAVFTHCVFQDSLGGAEVTGGAPRFLDCRFLANHAQAGGGIDAHDSQVYVANCTFSGNTADADGGAIRVSGTTSATAPRLTIASSLLTGNRGRVGSAIAVSGAGFVGRNLTVADNNAALFAAIFLRDATSDLANSILWNNLGTSSPGLLSGWDVPLSGAALTEAQQLSAHGGATVVQRTIIQGLTTFAGSNNSQYAPLFASAGAQPYALTASSPALARGQWSLLNAVLPTAADANRAADTNDLGAFEYTGTIATTINLSAVPSSTTIFSGSQAAFVVNNPALNAVTWQTFDGANWVPVGGSQWTTTTSGSLSTLTLTGAVAGDAGSYRYVIASRAFTSPPFTLTVKARTVVYVNAAAAPNGNGATWATACNTLEAALATGASGLELRVAAGTYTPAIALAVKPEVVVLGGFPADGSITDPALRNPATNVVTITDAAVNSPNLVVFDGVAGAIDGNTGFDGVTFQPTGRTTICTNIVNGASPRFTHCVFQFAPGGTEHVVIGAGSGADMSGCQWLNNTGIGIAVGAGALHVANGTFSGNSGLLVSGTGAIQIETSTFTANGSRPGVSTALISVADAATSLSLTRDVFTGNTADVLISSRGVVSVSDTLMARNTSEPLNLTGAQLVLQHVTIADNTSAAVAQAAVSNRDSGSATIVNSILWGNRVPGLTTGILAQQYALGGTVQIANSTIEGLAPAAADATSGLNPIFVDEPAGNFRLAPSSPAIGAGARASATPVDLGGLARSANSTDEGAYAFVGTKATTLALLSTPAAVASFVDLGGTFTVTFPSGLGTGVQWWYWDGAQKRALPSDGRFVVTTTSASSTLQVSGLTAGDAGAIVFTIGSYQSPAYALTVQPRPIRYVNAAAPTSTGDGTSWASAWRSVAAAVAQAPAGAQIWVANGTYGFTDPLRSGLQLYGGFTAGATAPDQRDTTGAGTILRGRIVNDGALRSIDATAVVDGFTLTDGVQNNRGAAPTFSHCIFRDAAQAVSVNAGGGTFTHCTFTNNACAVSLLSGNVTFTGCQFTGNAATLFSDLVDVEGGTLTIGASTFSGNTLSVSTLLRASGGTISADRLQILDNTGGTIFAVNGGGNLTVRNSLVANNATVSGGVLVASGGVADVVQSTIYGNTAPDTSAGLDIAGGTVTLRNSILWRNRLAPSSSAVSIEGQQAVVSSGALTATASIIEGFTSLGGSGNTSTDPLFTDSAGGDFTLRAISPAINTGSTAVTQTGFALDLAGNPRVSGGTPDRGAYEFEGTPGTAFAVTTAPNSTTVGVGDTAQFTVTAATGGGSAFIWQVQTAPGVFGDVTVGGLYAINVSGNTSTLSVGPVTSAEAENPIVVRVRLDSGAVSDPATLTVVSTRQIYVNAAAAGGAAADGSTWSTAYPTLAPALAAWSAGTEIWIANGTYTITAPIVMPSGMRLYGGFRGTETALAQRSPVSATIFQGVGLAYYIDQGSAPGAGASTVVDGIQFAGGAGGGVNNAQSSLTITNCTFSGFTGREAIVNTQSASLIQNCVFRNNTAGAICEAQSSSQILGCTFQDNTRSNAATGNLGSALLLSGAGSTTISDATFLRDGNEAVYVTGGATPWFDRCTWTYCTAAANAVLQADAGTTVEIRNSLLAKNATTGTHGVVTSAGTLTFRGVTVADNTNTLWSGNSGVVENQGVLTVVNSILWGNRTSAAPGAITTEQQQLYSPSATPPTVRSTTVEGLSAYAGNNNLPYDPLFDSRSPSGYALSALSPDVNAGDNTLAVLPATDAAGRNRQSGAAVDLGAFELVSQTGLTPVALAVNPNASAASRIVRVWSTLAGNVTISGSAATIAALQWQVLVNGAWVDVPSGNLAATATGTTSTLTASAPASDAVADQSVRFVIAGTPYISPLYTITTASNVLYVNHTAAAGGDGTSWSRAFRTIGEAIAAATPHTELWVQAGTYSETLSPGPGLRILGGFNGTEQLLAARPSSQLASLTGAIALTSSDSSTVIDGFRVNPGGAFATITHAGGVLRNCTFNGGTGAVVRNTSETVDFENCTFLGINEDPADTAIDHVGGTLVVNGCTFTSPMNAIAANGRVTITNTTIANAGNSNAGAHSILAIAGSSLTVTGCTFDGVSGDSPIAVTTAGPVVFSGDTFANTTARVAGAGAMTVSGATSLAIDHCVFTANHSNGALGSADATSLQVSGMPVVIRDSYFGGGFAGNGSGGAIHLTDCTTTFVANTVVNNSAYRLGGGLVLDQGSATSSATVANSLLWGNSVSDVALSTEQAQLAATGTTLSVHHTLVAGLDALGLSGTAMLGYDPQLTTQGSLQAPSATSPALNAGDATLVTNGETDVLGQTRVFGSAPDLGAVERQAAATTTSFSIAQTDKVLGGSIVVTAATAGQAGLFWQLDTGAGWQVLSGNIVSDVVSSGTRTLQLAWTPAWQGARLRLSNGLWSSAAVNLDFSTNGVVDGRVTSLAATGGNPPAFALALDAAFAPGGLTDATWVIHGSRHGRLLSNDGAWGSLTTDAIAPTLTPGITFAPGEVIDATASRDIPTALGGTFSPYVTRIQMPWQSRAGAFQRGVALTTTGAISGTAAGDLNGDGVTDLLFAGADGVWVCLGDGAGGYTRVPVTAGGAWDAIAVADFNADGKLDFAGSVGGAAIVVKTVASDGSGATDVLANSPAFGGTRLLAADFDGDGRQDLLVLGASAAEGEALLTNNGDGTFTAHAQRFATGDHTRDAAVADLDHNGTLDFIQLTASGLIRAWLNDGSGAFTAGAIIQVPNAVAFALADVDGDGYADLVISGDDGGNRLFAWRNDHNGNFSQTRAWAGGVAQQLAAADFNGDGAIDLLAISGTTADTLWTNNGAGVFTATTLGWTSSGASADVPVTIADVNDDGAADVLLPQGAQPLLWRPGIYFAGVAKTTSENVALTFANADFAAATTSLSGATLEFYRVDSVPAHGTLKLSGQPVLVTQLLSATDFAGLTYTPATNYYGPDAFTLSPEDSGGVSPAGTVALTIARVYAPPVPQAQSVTAYLNNPLPLTLQTTNPENVALTYVITTAPTHGTLAAAGGANVTYTPETGYTGADAFAYLVSDGHGNEAAGAVNITVQGATQFVTSSAATGAGSLHDALLSAIANGGTWQIAIDASLSGQTLSVEGSTDTTHGATAFLIPAGVTITLDGSAAPGVSVRPGAAGNLRLFRVAAGGQLVLEALDVSDWTTGSETASTPARGAAVYNEGALVANNVTFSGNTADGTAGAGAEGGAVYGNGGTLSFTQVVFTNNAASDSAGAGQGGAVFQRNGASTFTRASFSGNSAPLTGADVQVTGDHADVTDTWYSTTVAGLSVAQIGNGGVTTTAVESDLPATLPVWLSAIPDQSATAFTSVPVTVSPGTASVFTQTSDLTFTAGSQGPIVGVPASETGTSRTFQIAPLTGEVGSLTASVIAFEGVYTFVRQVPVAFSVPPSVPPNAPAQTIAIIDNQPRSFTLAATSADGQPIRYELLDAPQHGTLTGTAPNLTYTPANDGATRDTFSYRVIGYQDRVALENLTANYYSSTPVVNNTSADLAGSLADILAQAPYVPGTYDVTIAFAGSGFETSAQVQATPAGPSIFRITGHVILDASATAGVSFTGNGSARLFYIAPGATLELRNVSFSGGVANGDATYPGSGGAIYNDGGTLIMTGGALTNSTATGASGASGLGGAIYNNGGNVTLTGVTLSNNTAAAGLGGSSAGGAIYTRNGALSLAGVTLAANTAAAGPDVSIVADGVSVTFDDAASNVAALDTTLLNGGTMQIRAHTATVSGPNLPSIGAVSLPTISGSLAQALPLANGTPFQLTLSTSDPVALPASWFALTGGNSAPVLQVAPDPAASASGTVTIAANFGAYQFTRDIAIATAPYAAPTLGDVAVAVTFGAQSATFVLNGTVTTATSTYTLVTPPAHGAISGTAPNGNLRYTPADGFAGTDTAVYRLTDATGNSATGTVTFTVAPPYLPKASDDGATSVGSNTSNQGYVYLIGNTVLPNGNFASGVPLTFTIAVQPQHGTLTATSDPTLWLYTPNPGYVGADEVQYTVADPFSVSAPGRFAITVVDSTGDFAPTIVGMPPTAPTIRTDAGEVFPFASVTAVPMSSDFTTGAYMVLTVPDAAFGTLDAGDLDSFSNVWTWTDSTHASIATYGTSDDLVAALHGLGFVPNGSYVPSGTGPASVPFTFVIADDIGVASTTTYNLLLEPGGAAPTAASITTSTAFETPVSVALQGAQAESYPLTYAIDVQPDHGTVTLSGGTATYTPAALYSGTDQFHYAATAASGSAGATVTVTITPQVVVAPTLSIRSRSAGSVTLTAAGSKVVAYDLFTSTDLANWSPLGTISTDATRIGTYDDTATIAPGNSRFYRAAIHDGSPGNPVGALRLLLRGNSDTIVSLPYHRAALVTSTVASVSGSAITLTATLPSLPTEGAYALVLSGALEGAVLPVTATNGGTATVAAGSYDLTTLHTESANGVGEGDGIALVPYWTLDTAFPAGLGVNPSTDTTTHASEILVFDNTTVGTQLATAAYYYFAGASDQPAGWYKTGGGAVAQGTLRLAPQQYFIVRHNVAGDTYLVTCGQVQLAGYSIPLAVLRASTSQDNNVALPIAVPTTLAGSGLFQAGAFTASTSLLVSNDLVLVYDNGTVVHQKSPSATFFYFVGNSSKPAGWYKVGAAGTTSDNFELRPGEGLVVRKKGTTTTQVKVWSATPPYLQ